LGVAATAGLAFGFAAAGFDLGFFSFVLLSVKFHALANATKSPN
jgi:hypothetical protein